MTANNAKVRLEALGKELDYESAHYEADLLLCELLESLGYRDVVEAYSKVGKFYGQTDGTEE